MKIAHRHLSRIISEEILRESRYFGMSVADILSYLEGFGNNTWIFFDTETTGLKPHSRQLTEIAAVAVGANNWQESQSEPLGTLNVKIKLTDETHEQVEDEAQNPPTGRKKSIADLLQMTSYEEPGREYLEEQEAVSRFLAFVESFPDPVLVAQNAAFDMEFISVRSGGRMNTAYPVIDTMRVMQLFLVPLLRTLSGPPHNDTEAAELLSKLKQGGRYRTSMGVVSPAYGISIEGWHRALEDVKMMMKMFRHVVQTLRSGVDVDISKEHGVTAAYQSRRKKGRKKKRRVSETKLKITRRQLKQLIREACTKCQEEMEGDGHEPSTEIRPSPIHGVGIFVITYTPADSDLGVAQTMRRDGGHDITQLGRYHNHSTEPSCHSRLVGNERHLFTSRDMEPGEEVTVDYRQQQNLEQPEEDWAEIMDDLE